LALSEIEDAPKGQRIADIPNIQCNITLLGGTLGKIFKTISSSGTTISQNT
jgi:hypothetical protein